MDKIELIFKTIGGLVTVGAFIFTLGKLFGKSEAKDKVQEVKDKVEAGKVVELSCELAVMRTKLEAMNETLHDLQAAKLLSTQKHDTYEGQLKVMFEMINKQGEKLEDFFNKMYDLKG